MGRHNIYAWCVLYCCHCGGDSRLCLYTGDNRLSILQLSKKFETPLEAYLKIDREVDTVTAEEI